MADYFSLTSDADSDPTLPHMPYVPTPEDEEALALTQPSGMPAVRGDAAGLAAPHPAGTYGGFFAPVGDREPIDAETRERVARERDRKRRVRERERRISEWAWVVVALALFGVTMVFSVSLFAVLRAGREQAADASGGMISAQATAMVIVPTAVPNLSALNIEEIDAAGQGDAAPMGELGITPWNGQERFTILMMGWDRRPGDDANAAYRTDTMMLVSLDPQTNQIGVLSIPRDLYVNIPGYSQLQRVNSAYVLGELRQPGYGPRLAMETVQYNLGIRIHDYLVVDFNAFIKVIDAIGGIDVDVPYNISDPQYPDMNYGYDPFSITAGLHHLDGTTALKYARTRHGSSDFRRAERQQQVFFAIRDQVLSVSNLTQLLAAAPAVWANIREGVKTGLTFDQMLQLAWYAKDIPAENFHTGVIDEEYITFYTTSTGASVVIPNRYSLGPLMVSVFGENYNQ